MKYFKYLVFVIVTSWVCGFQSQIQASSLTFDQAIERGGFDNPQMRSVMQLWDPDGVLSHEIAHQLLESTALTNLRTLDLKNENIDDDFIRQLCQNPTFARLINIDLSGNENITSQSLQYILDSDIIGSIRDLPQISGRYGCPSSEVYITIDGTSISKEDMQPYLDKPRHGFVIRYLSPQDRASSPTVNNAIKWLQRRY